MHKITFLLLLLVSISVAAQDLVTDRPDQTESASIVPELHVQLESGISMTTQNKLSDITSIESLLRLGVLSNLEFRLGFANATTVFSGEPKNSISNIVFPGFKYQVFKGAGIIPDIAIMGGFALPVSYDDNADSFWAPEFRIAAQHDLLEFLSLGYNYGLFWESDAYNTQQFYSVAMGLNLIPRTGIFVEFFGENFEDLGSTGYVDGGFTFSILNNLQLDAYVGYGLNDISDDVFVGAGLTIRLPK